MTCPCHPFGDPTGLACTRTDEHHAGHVYQAAWCPDRHDLSEARATA